MSEWIIGVITQWNYAGLFLLMLLENVFPPIPSELIMPFAGYAAANGELSAIGVMIAGTLGSLAGTSAWYVAARLLGLKRFTYWCNRLGRFATVTEDDIDMAVRWFDKYGPVAVFIGRLIPAIRTLISVPAGLAAMPVWMFLGISLVGTLAWNAILIGAGFLLHENYEAVEAWVDPVSTTVLVLGVLVYIYRFVTWRPIKDVG